MPEATTLLIPSRWALRIDGDEVVEVHEILSLISEVKSVQYVDSGSEKSDFGLVPGPRTPPTVVFRRGMSKDLRLSAWHDAVVVNGPQEMKNCSLTAFATDGKQLARFELMSAWPSKIEISAIKAPPPAPLYETVTLVCDEVRRVTPK
jgi:phage tail-like protein